MGVDPAQRRAEVRALQYGIDHGLTVIDTAEMYAEGQSEVVVGEAIAGRRSQVFLVSKVWPTNQSAKDLPESLAATLRRLRTDYLDLYLLHWPSSQHPLEEVAAALGRVQQEGLSRYVGVSNYPWEYWQRIQELMPSSVTVPVNQVEYNLLNRRAEHRLLPQTRDHHLTLMAYSPVKGVIALDPSSRQSTVLRRVAADHHTHPATVALAYVIGSGNVLAIPKAIQYNHIDSNCAALDLTLSEEERQLIQDAFPSPAEDIPYEAL